MKRESDLKQDNFHYKTETEFEAGKFNVDLDDGTYIIFDLETTGGNPSRNGITEIAAIKYSKGKVQDSFYSLVNPKIAIPPIVQKMTGITNQTVRNAPPIESVFPPFLEFIENHVLVSHNTVGDMTFLVHFAKKVCRHKLTNFFLCTHLLAEKTVYDSPNYSLSGLSAHLKLPSGGKSHRAESDAQMTLQLFLELKRRMQTQHEIKLLKDALRFQGHVDTNLRLGLALDESRFDRVSKEPGVLALYDHKGSLLFAGSCFNLRRELLNLRQYEALPRRFLKLVLHAYHFHSYPTSSLFAAMIKEAEFMSKHKFSYDPLRWHGRSLSLLHILEESDGTLQIGLGDYPFTVLPILKVLGPVKDLKTTQNKLKALAEILESVYEKKTLTVPAEKSRLIKLLLEDKLDEEVDRLRRERFKLANLLSLVNQRKISSEIQSLKELSNLDIRDNMTDLSSINGVLILPHEDKSEREVYPIIRSHVMKPHMMSADTSDDQYKALFVKHAEKFKAGVVSELDMLKTSALLWMITVGINKKQSDAAFKPFDF